MKLNDQEAMATGTRALAGGVALEYVKSGREYR